MFEPVHGSAPDIAGKGIANPIGQILVRRDDVKASGRSEAAECRRERLTQVLAQAKVRTPDIGGKATTKELGASDRDMREPEGVDHSVLSQLTSAEKLLSGQ